MWVIFWKRVLNLQTVIDLLIARMLKAPWILDSKLVFEGRIEEAKVSGDSISSILLYVSVKTSACLNLFQPPIYFMIDMGDKFSTKKALEDYFDHVWFICNSSFLYSHLLHAVI